MNNFLISVFALLALSANAWASGAGLPQPAAVRTLLNYPSNSSLRTAQLGTQVIDHKVQLMKATYSFAVQGGSDTVAITLLDADGKDAVLPNKALIKQVMMDWSTAATSGGSATISLGANTTTDLKNALAVASATGKVDGVPVNTAATAVKTTAQRTLKFTVATAPLTAGICNVFVEYYLDD